MIDGDNAEGRLWGKYCGKIAPPPLVSSGPYLFIKFVSDYETHGAGFSIRYEVFKRGEKQFIVTQFITCDFYLHHKLHHTSLEWGKCMKMLERENLTTLSLQSGVYIQ